MAAAFLGQTLSQSPHRALKRLRSAAVCSLDNGKPDDDSESGETELSRRVFLAGITFTTAATALVGYRIVIGEDVEARIFTKIKNRFPALFPHESTPDERRRPLDPAFPLVYLQAVEDVAVEMRIITRSILKEEETQVRQRAFNLFFQDGLPQKTLSNTSWFNFLLYSRLHVIAQRTSPASRLEFVDKLSRSTLRALKTPLVKQSKQISRLNPDTWLGRIHDLLKELVEIGWISGYRIEDFDGEPGSAWQDEGRSSLTVYAYDPVSIQAAQLIGEEEFEELSPKVSGWIRAFLIESGISVTFEDYYLDDQYRPDPDQFKPSQLATQFDLSL